MNQKNFSDLRGSFDWLKGARIPFLALIFLLLAAPLSNSAQRIKKDSPGASSWELPHTTADMKTPEFWIRRHPDPDRIVLEPSGIERFNQMLRDKGLTQSLIDEAKTVVYESISKNLDNEYKRFINRTFYDEKGRPVPLLFYEALKLQMNLKALRACPPIRFALVVQRTNQRVLPSDDILTAKPLDLLFDELQNSSLDRGTPLAVFHESADGAWVFTRGISSDGWVRKADLGFCSRSQLQSFLKPKDIWVSTAAEMKIYSDHKLKSSIDSVRMGARFPLQEPTGSGERPVAIAVPFRTSGGDVVFKRGFVRFQDGHHGFLPYTPRNVYLQAFKLLGREYRWGGKDREQDCSGFVMEVFATLGIDLPRNSSQQGKSGIVVDRLNGPGADQKKRAALQKAMGGITLISMDGHILLFLGMWNGNPYAIHAAYSYALPKPKGGRRILNQVVVSDLTLGEKSERGSLFDRLQRLVVVDLPVDPPQSPSAS